MKVSTSPIIYLGTNKFKYLNTGKIKPEESFMNARVEKLFELEHSHTSTKLLNKILYAKKEKEHLNKVTKNQWQNLTQEQCNELIKFLQNTKSCLMEQLAIGNHIY